MMTREEGFSGPDPRAQADAFARLMSTYVDKYGSWQNALIRHHAGGAPLERGYLPERTALYLRLCRRATRLLKGGSR
jgi:hypothetical protein